MSFEKVSQNFFETLYLNSDDPWSFASSEYELNRYQIMIKYLEHKIYAHTFEPGCSNGVLTKMLAGISKQVTSFDISQQAVDLAKKRCENLSHISLTQGTLRTVLPAPSTDLIVLSEVGYYFHQETLANILDQLVLNSASDLTLLAVHWLGHSADHLLTGDEVHAVILANDNLILECSERYESFRLDRLIKKCK